MESKFNIAVLIDGDNAQAKLIQEIIAEVSIYGKATIRRIYGDWTTPQMNSWKGIVNQFSISPIQKFSYTSGKNSTDSSLIIDAMDILHANNVDGFCIVSSDSDYTGLAKRIREEGLFVMGIGSKTTPIAFVSSCEIFTFTENLTPLQESAKIDSKETGQDIASNEDASETQNKEGVKESIVASDSKPLDDDLIEIDPLKLINKAFEISAHEYDQVYISQIGGALRKIDPSFDPRTYGYKSLTKMFETLDNYEVIKNETNGHPMLRPKPNGRKNKK